MGSVQTQTYSTHVDKQFNGASDLYEDRAGSLQRIARAFPALGLPPSLLQLPAPPVPDPLPLADTKPAERRLRKMDSTVSIGSSGLSQASRAMVDEPYMADEEEIPQERDQVIRSASSSASQPAFLTAALDASDKFLNLPRPEQDASALESKAPLPIGAPIPQARPGVKQAVARKRPAAAPDNPPLLDAAPASPQQLINSCAAEPEAEGPAGLRSESIAPSHYSHPEGGLAKH